MKTSSILTVLAGLLTIDLSVACASRASDSRADGEAHTDPVITGAANDQGGSTAANGSAAAAPSASASNVVSGATPPAAASAAPSSSAFAPTTPSAPVVTPEAPVPVGTPAPITPVPVPVPLAPGPIATDPPAPPPVTPAPVTPDPIAPAPPAPPAPPAIDPDVCYDQCISTKGPKIAAFETCAVKCGDTDEGCFDGCWTSSGCGADENTCVAAYDACDAQCPLPAAP